MDWRTSFPQYPRCTKEKLSSGEDTAAFLAVAPCSASPYPSVLIYKMGFFFPPFTELYED